MAASLIVLTIIMVALIALSYMTLSKRISSISVSPAAAAVTTDYEIQPTVTGGSLTSATASVTPLSNKITMLTYDVNIQPNTNVSSISCVINQPGTQTYSNLRNVIIEGSSSNGSVDIYNIAYTSNLAAGTLNVSFTVNDTSVHKIDVILFLN